MKIGIWGGTFDPIHNGHIAMMKESAAALELDRVLVMPAFLPPHKAGVSKAEHRLAMLKLAIEGSSLFELDCQELQRDSLSYSVTSCESLKQKYPHDELYFCMGADSYKAFHTWFEWQRILERVNLAVVTRPGYEVANPVVEHHLATQTEANQVFTLQLTPHDVSSTVVRQSIYDGEPCGHLVPLTVWRYIQENALYL